MVRMQPCSRTNMKFIFIHYPCPGQLLLTNANIQNESFPTVAQATVAFSVKDEARILISRHSSYNQYGYQLQHYKPELFDENVNYSNSENALATVLTNSHNQYDDKIENFHFPADVMNEEGACKHRRHEDGDENFDSYMETNNENEQIRMTE